MANRSFKILEGSLSTSSSSISTPTNWNLCIICQAETSENLNCPALSNRKDVGSGYKSIDPFTVDRTGDSNGVFQTIRREILDFRIFWLSSHIARFLWVNLLEPDENLTGAT